MLAGEAWEDEQQSCGGSARDGDDREPGAHADSAPEYRGRRGERREGDGVDQAEHDQRETQRAHARATAWVAADDGDAHRVVETAGKQDPDQSGSAVAGRKRERPRPLAGREQPAPSPRLEALSEKQQQADRYQHAWLSARQRPGAGREVARGEERQGRHRGSRRSGERPPAPT